MKKSDALTGIGLGVAIVLIGWAMSSGSNIMIFWDLPSVAITIGGSFCAVLMGITMSDLKKMGKVFIQAFKEPANSKVQIVTEFASLSKKARREGLLSLEDEVSGLDDDFLKKGLQMVVDGIEPEVIREIMDLEIEEMESRHKSGSGLFATWGAYAPAFGMVGTLIGLIQMLQNLTDTTTIASGMGKALITTFYGTILANMFCNPIAANLDKKSAMEVSTREMMLEGILAIQSGVNPRIVEEKLMTYLNPSEKEEFKANNSENGDNEGVV